MPSTVQTHMLLVACKQGLGVCTALRPLYRARARESEQHGLTGERADLGGPGTEARGAGARERRTARRSGRATQRIRAPRYATSVRTPRNAPLREICAPGLIRVQRTTRGRMSRRQLLGRTGAVAAGLLVAGTLRATYGRLRPTTSVQASLRILCAHIIVCARYEGARKIAVTGEAPGGTGAKCIGSIYSVHGQNTNGVSVRGTSSASNLGVVEGHNDGGGAEPPFEADR